MRLTRRLALYIMFLFITCLSAFLFFMLVWSWLGSPDVTCKGGPGIRFIRVVFYVRMDNEQLFNVNFLFKLS